MLSDLVGCLRELYDLYLSDFYERYVRRPSEWRQWSLWSRANYLLTRLTIVYSLCSIVTTAVGWLVADQPEQRPQALQGSSYLPAALLTVYAHYDLISFGLTVLVTILLIAGVEIQVRRRERAARRRRRKAT